MNTTHAFQKTQTENQDYNTFVDSSEKQRAEQHSDVPSIACAIEDNAFHLRSLNILHRDNAFYGFDCVFANNDGQHIANHEGTMENPAKVIAAQLAYDFKDQEAQLYSTDNNKSVVRFHNVSEPEKLLTRIYDTLQTDENIEHNIQAEHAFSAQKMHIILNRIDTVEAVEEAHLQEAAL